MKYEYFLDIKKQKSQYLYSYYNVPFVWFLRRFVGPILVLLALIEFSIIDNPSSLTVIPVLFGFIGIYYIVRPYVFLRNAFFQDTHGSFSIGSDEFVIASEKGELRLSYNEILKIIPKKRYVFIKVRLHVVQYFLVDLDTIQGDGDEFLKELIVFANKKQSPHA
ncbi:hypothetical protein AB3N59_13785 [Leptospira sp. WS92.C1]